MLVELKVLAFGAFWVFALENIWLISDICTGVVGGTGRRHYVVIEPGARFLDTAVLG